MKTKLPTFGMRMLTLILVMVTGSLTQSYGQTVIASDGLNNSSTLFTLSNGTFYSGNSGNNGSGDRPSNSAFASEGSYGYGKTNGTATLTSTNSFNTSAYGNVQLSLDLAAFALGNSSEGLDATDAVSIAISTDGGTNYSTILTVTGNNNAYWAYSASGNATAAYPTAVSVGPSNGGSRTADGYSNMTITGLPSIATLKVRITLTNNSNNERWVVDNFILTGSVTKTWIGANNGSWNTAGNWSPSGVPATSDSVVFNTSRTVSVNVTPNTLRGLTVTNNSTVTLVPSSSTDRAITLSNPSKTALSIVSGSSLTLDGYNNFGTSFLSLAFSGSGNISSIAGSLNINSTGDDGKYIATNSISTVTGTLTNNGGQITSSTTSLIFNSGSNYIHAIDGGTIPTAKWNSGSTCSITGNSGAVPSGLAPSGGFANFTWNSPGQSATDNVSFVGVMTQVNGDFSVISTGSGSLRLVNSGVAATLNIGGNFSQTGGTFYPLGSGGSGTSSTVTIGGDFSLSGVGTTFNMNGSGGTNNTVNINVAGDFSHTSGTLTTTATSASNFVFNGGTTQTYTSGGTVTNAVNFTVNSGTTLQMGTAASPSFISGAGKFSMQNGSTLGVTSADGISATSTTLGNIRSSGTRSYFVTAGSTSFIYNGGAAQQTGDGLPATVNIFNISNASGVTLTNNLTVNGALTLINGKIDASNKNLTLASAAAVNGSGGSSSSYVITGDGVSTLGTLIRPTLVNGSNSLFPIGTSSYYLPVIVKPASTNQSFAAYVFQGASMDGVSGGTPIANKKDIVDAVWNVNRTAGTGNADLTLQWDDALEGSSFANYDNSNIGISHFTASTWQAGAQTTANAAANTVTNTFNSFSPFGVGTISIPLPVILVDFNAVMEKNKTVDLSWSTQMEVNFSHFDVERSADGASWQSIGTVQAKGNASYVTNYAFNDASPLATTGYYRLKMVDLDGKYGYTEIKVIRASLVTDISIFPNPAKDFINVSVGGSASELTVKLVNISGQVLMEKKINSITASTISLPVHNYPQGSYFVQVAGADGSQQVNKVVITR